MNLLKVDMGEKLKYIVAVTGLMLLVFNQLNAQVSIERSVLGSTGNYTEFVINSDPVNVSSSIGEAFYDTYEGSMLALTQGFMQPNVMLLAALASDIATENSQCPDVHTGVIVVSPTGCLGPYNIEVANETDTFNLTDVETGTFENLAADTFAVKVVGQTFCTRTDTIIVDAEYEEDCNLEFYTGITPNGDGFNDVWIIDNIEINQPNTVNIFNRYGNVVWEGENYDNDQVVWTGFNSNSKELPEGTYFYVIKTPTEDFSGWVELTR